MRRYSLRFYEFQRNPSVASAREVVPLVIELIQPESVIDVGCGTGAWLSVFRDQGIEDVVGVDGNWVDKEMLLIPEERFVPGDLREPIRAGRQFDLVVSLEVAEHIPAVLASSFVDSLTSLGPVVLFSAAIPGQGGTHHVNEQWPEYWANLFRERGFAAVDCLRRRIWNNDAVQWWYAQNTFLFVHHDQLQRNISLQLEYDRTDQAQLSLVHPKQYLAARERGRPGLPCFPRLPYRLTNRLQSLFR